MREFIDTALSFPTIVFSISTIFFLGFWVVTTLIGAGVNSLDDFDFDLDADVDVDVEIDAGVDTDVDSDLDLDSDSSGGLLQSALAFLGITGMPILISMNLLSLFSWLASMIIMTIVGGGIAWLLGIPVMVGSFLVGGFLTGRIARRFAHVFVPTLALRRKQLVGNACIISTQRVTADFGQAEVRDDEGGSLIVQVRCLKANDLQAGDRALIFDLDADAGVFQVSADKSLAP